MLIVQNATIENEDLRSKSTIFLHYYLLLITSKIVNASFSEKWKVKSEEVKSKNPERFRIQDFLVDH